METKMPIPLAQNCGQQLNWPSENRAILEPAIKNVFQG